MSHSDFGRGGTGIHTVEGNQAGARAAKLTQKREQDQREFEAKKRKIQDDSQRAMDGFDQKFSSIQQTAFNLDFVGLKTKEELLNLKGAAEEEAARQKIVEEEEARRREKEEKKKKKQKQTKVARLSFAMGGDNDEDDDSNDDGGRSSRPTKKIDTVTSPSSSGSSTSFFKKRKTLKNPEAETSFLRDPEEEKEHALLRENLKLEWLAEQERVKEEILEVTYSYWDGSGHRRVLKCKKGTTIAKFVEMVKSQEKKK
eukprot:evm.model.NODE_14087_length_57995_cov_43.650368.7